MKKISVGKGLFALVDDEDFSLLMGHKWRAFKDKNNYRAARTDRSNGKKTVYMHRQIMGVTNRLIFVDHINHNTLDNRRKNLRLCSNAENRRNSLPNKNTSSRFKGVCWHKENKKWHAKIKKDGKSLHVGIYKSEKHAAIAYDGAARALFGRFASINIVDKGD